VKKSGDLLSLTYNLAGLVFEGESEQLWLVRRFEMLKDILEESWTYQRIKEEGREEGQLQGQRQALLLLIQTRYSALVQLAEDVCNAIRILEELQDLFQKVLLANDEQEVRQLLMSVQK
jgi:flagellar biosynthesis/type III secretory pathway protein FliH